MWTTQRMCISAADIVTFTSVSTIAFDKPVITTNVGSFLYVFDGFSEGRNEKLKEIVF